MQLKFQISIPLYIIMMRDDVAAPLPARGRLSKTTPISTSEKTAEPGEENSSNNK